jgi:WD40 repeat protein
MVRSLLLVVLSVSVAVPAFADEAGNKPIEPENVSLGRPVSFEKDIRDIFELNCVACHYDGGAESRLVVENAASMLKGGKRGAGIVPGKPDESLIYLVAARKKAPHMPPLPNKVEAAALTPRELGILRQWIIEGAKSDGMDTGSQVKWQPIPAGMTASYAVALAPWADRIAASRANQLSILGVSIGEEVKLIDPNLSAIRVDDQEMYPGGAAHRDFVHSVAFHPNGRMLASGGFRVVKLWEQPQNVQAMKTPLGAVAADMDVNVAKQLVAIGTQQNSILLRSLTDGTEVRKFDGHTGPVSGVALTADAAQLVSGSQDKSIRIWSVETGAVIRTIDSLSPVHDLCLTIDGKEMIAAHDDGVIRVWSMAAPAAALPEGETEKPVREFKGHGKPVRSVALILPAGQFVVSGSDDNTAKIWNVANGSATQTLNHGGPVVSVAARPDGKFIASASSNNTAKLWDATNGKQIAELRGHLPAQRAELVAKEEADLAKQLVALSDTAQKDAEKNATERADALKKANEANDKAAKAVEDQKTKVAEAKGKADEGQKTVDEAKKTADDAQVKADEAKKASDAKTDDADLKKATDDAAAEAKKLADALKAPTDAQKKLDEELKKQDDELKKQDEALKSATRSVDLAVKADAKAKVDFEAAKAAHTKSQEHQKAQDDAYKNSQEATKAAEKPQTAVAFSANGNRLAVAAEDDSITIYAGETGIALDVLAGGSPVRSLVFSTEKMLVAAGDDQSAVVWDTNPDWKLVGQLGAAADNPLDTSASPFEFRVLSLAFSPDGSKLATGGGEPSRSGELMIWDVAKR